METLYEMVWRLYEGEEDTAEICARCHKPVDECRCEREDVGDGNPYWGPRTAEPEDE